MRKAKTLGILELQVMLAVRKYPSQNCFYLHKKIIEINSNLLINTVRVTLLRLMKKGFLEGKIVQPTEKRVGRRANNYLATDSGLGAIGYTLKIIQSLSS